MRKLFCFPQFLSEATLIFFREDTSRSFPSASFILDRAQHDFYFLKTVSFEI